jgi:DNA-binding transcriptional MerR regulator
MSSPSEPPVEPTNRGIFDGFEGYRTATRDDHVEVLKGGLVAIDANVLLDLYRYGKQGRDDLIAALRAIGNRLWVPNHAMVEFWRNREGVLKDPGGTVQLVKTLGTSKETIVKAIDLWGKQRSHPQKTVEEFTAEVTRSLDEIKDQVAELSKEETDTWARDTSKDEVLQALNEILEGKVGRPLTEEAYGAALTEAKRRGDEQIPPGYLDAKKPEPDSAGDYLVWEQLLLEASQRQLDVLLITRDAKDDWVRREGGEIRGPRMELIDEALARTGHRFFLRTPAQLLDLAKDALDVAVHTESVENADRLSRELTDWELNGYRTSAPADSEFVSNLLTAEFILTELEESDPTAGTALKLAALRDGRLNVKTLERMNIFPSPHNVERVADGINAVINNFVQRDILPERALLLLVPIYDEKDEDLRGYLIHPDFMDAFRKTALADFPQDRFPMKFSEIQNELVGHAPPQHYPWETTVAGERMPTSPNAYDGREISRQALKRNPKRKPNVGMGDTHKG